MINKIKHVMILFMLIGIVGITINMIFGQGTITYITTYTNSVGDIYYKYDFKSYFTNITTQIQNTTNLSLTLPTREWQSTGEWGAITNDLALILDYIIFGLNVIIYPFRLGGYILQNIWAFIGISETINDTSEIYWLYQLSKYMQLLQIPYI